MTAPIPTPILDLSFPHNWQAEVLSARPLILPSRHFVYPREAEEVERGALEVLIRPEALGAPGLDSETGESVQPPPSAQEPAAVKGTGFSPYIEPSNIAGALAPEEKSSGAGLSPVAQPFLATCALGFRDPAVPTGLWSTPHPSEICAVSGGYAYLIDTTAPERFTMIPYRPVLELRPLPAEGLLLFVGHRSILAWGSNGQAWESEKLSDEGITITSIESGVLRGLGWNLMADKETPFALDLRTGLRAS